MCDVEGYCYIPFLEETGYMPQHKYSYGHEIRGQIERSADHFGIRGQFCTSIDSQIWDEEKKRWVVTMTRTVGEPSMSTTFRVFADFILMSLAPFVIPKMPQTPGWEEFYSKKHVFHSSRWDYEYTGGSQEKPDLTKLKGKRVAIIGTGATAVQIVPELAKWAEHVYVVQRTPAHVGPRNQAETDPEHWAKITSEKGWQKKRRLAFDAYISDSPGYGPDLVNDGWTSTPAGSGYLGSKSRIVTPDKVEEHIKELHMLDIPRTELLRKRVDEIVKDKRTAEKLKAWYGSWCKRPSFHDEYLQTFNKPNVTLIDTDGKGLDRYTGNGIQYNGIEYEIDALVLATGFLLDTNMAVSEKMEASIQGRDGVTMKAYWSAPDAGTLLGVAVPGFPNAFGFFNRGFGSSWNMASSMDMKAALIVGILKQAQKQISQSQRAIIEASTEGEKEYGLEVAKRAGWFTVMATCTPGWFNGEGSATLKTQKQEAKTEEQLINEGKKAAWGGGPVDYKEMAEEYVANGNMRGFTVEPVAAQA
jgi:cation diffusion facilitator CzcD-associated flavoprotein CzcO